VINRGLVAQLQSDTDELSANLDVLREDFRELQDEARVLSTVLGGFGEEAMEPLLAGRLAGQQVVLVTQAGTSADSLGGLRRALEVAGAEVAATLEASPRMALTSEADREALSSIVGVDPAEEPEAIGAAAAGLVATRLAEGPNGTETLEELLEEDFLLIQGARLTETGLRTLGGPETAVVAVAGGPEASELDPSGFLVPLVTSLLADGMPVAAAEPFEVGEEEPPFVTLLRAEAGAAGLLATQDNVDQVAGQIGLALALEDLLQGDPGHYGVKDGASRVFPELP
jgi:hypothetical protein